MYCNGKCCCKYIMKIALRISTLFNLLNQHLQSQDEEKKSGNESPSIYASRIYSTTIYSFSNSWFHDANDVLDAKSYGNVRGSRSSQSNPIVDMDTKRFVNVSTITRSNSTWPIRECSEFGNRLSKWVFTTQMKHRFFEW